MHETGRILIGQYDSSFSHLRRFLSHYEGLSISHRPHTLAASFAIGIASLHFLMSSSDLVFSHCSYEFFFLRSILKIIRKRSIIFPSSRAQFVSTCLEVVTMTAALTAVYMPRQWFVLWSSITREPLIYWPYQAPLDQFASYGLYATSMIWPSFFMKNVVSKFAASAGSTSIRPSLFRSP